MLRETIIQKMKQTNISTDPEKTKQRVKELWKSATKEEKEAVEALAGIKRVTVERIYRTGSISAKLAVSIAQILNADPFYLTGESDERGEYTKEILKNLMEKHQYEWLLAEQAKLDRKPAGKLKVTPKPAENPNPELEVKEDKTELIDKKLLDKVTEDDMVQLIHTLLIRSEKIGGEYKERLYQIKSLLVQ